MNVTRREFLKFVGQAVGVALISPQMPVAFLDEVIEVRPLLLDMTALDGAFKEIYAAKIESLVPDSSFLYSLVDMKIKKEKE